MYHITFTKTIFLLFFVNNFTAFTSNKFDAPVASKRIFFFLKIYLASSHVMSPDPIYKLQRVLIGL